MTTGVQTDGAARRAVRPPGGRVTWRTARSARPAEQGSISVFVVFFAITALILASLLVDVGGAVNAQERAADIAEQAARAAADTIDPGSLRSGNVAIDTTTACQHAQAIIARYDQLTGVQAEMQQDCAYSAYSGVGPRQVTVYVKVTSVPLLSTVLPAFTMKAHESACAEYGVDQGVTC